MQRFDFNDVAGLAAAHAALDHARREWRSDILISSIIEILASRGVLTERQLHLKLKGLWLTNAVDRATLRSALTWAEKENLVERRQRIHDDSWAATPTSTQDANADKKSAIATLESFQEDIQQKLDILEEGRRSIGEKLARDLTHILISAFMAGSDPVFTGVTQATDPSRLDAIYFDQEAVAAYLREHIGPAHMQDDLIAHMQDNLIALARAAIDPTQEFGTEILHLIVTGRVLQGMLARRDLEGRSPVSGTMLLLDTSVLVYRLYPDGPQPKMLEDLLEASHEAGCRAVVTRAVLDEWAGVWRAADKEAQSQANSATGIPSGTGHFLKNPAIRGWLWDAKEGRHQQTWAEFKKRYSQIEPWLFKHHVQIIENGEANPDLVEQLREELMRLADSAQLRTATTAQTDAYSAALVAEAREREPAPIPRSWFIAQDRLTNRAYRAVRPDTFPLAATVETWLLMMAVTKTQNPDEACNLAEVVGEAVILNSFLAVSAGYTVDDLVDLADVLSVDATTDADELADQFKTEFFAQAACETGDFSAALAQHRARRRNRQVARKLEQVNARESELQALVADAELRGQRKESLKRAEAEARNKQWQYRYFLTVALGFAGLGIVLSAFLGGSALVVGVATAAWIGCAAQGIRWLGKKPTETPWLFVAGIVATIAWTVLGSLLGVTLARPAAAHPAPGRPVSNVSSPASSRSAP
jgi:hypothetical protein